MSTNNTAPVIRLSDDIAWDAQADVIIVGTGVAGDTTAINCADLGLSVIMVEKAAIPGGTSAKSGAGMLIPNNSYQRARGNVESKRDFIAFLARVGRPLLFDATDQTFGLPQWEYDLIETYFDNAGDALAHLESLDALRVLHIPDWPSYNEVSEDKMSTGRYVVPQDDDGHWSNGADAIRRMMKRIDEFGVDVRLSFRVDAVYLNGDDEVVGVRGTQLGKTVSLRAWKAVVFASGGFTHNKTYTDEYLNGQIAGGCAALSNTGDFIPIAKSLGLPLHQMNGAFFAPLVYEQALDKDAGLIANFNCAGDSVLIVNKYGVRVSNEKVTYNDRTQAHFTWDPTRTEYPNFLQFVVMDKRCRDRYAYEGPIDMQAGNFIPTVGESTKYFIEADTLEDLAAQFAERLGRIGSVRLADDFGAHLQATIERFNGFARSGVDADFGRGETAIEKFFMALDDQFRPPDPDEVGGSGINSAMFPIAEHGPYYGIILAPGALDTKGGPKVNGRLQILDGDEQPVPGLYGLGNCVASASGQAYWSAGCTWGPYLTFGHVAARSIVDEPVKNIAPAHAVAG
jgi:hypothetical protein